MVDGSAFKPALRQDTGYMVEKTYPEVSFSSEILSLLRFLSFLEITQKITQKFWVILIKVKKRS